MSDEIDIEIIKKTKESLKEFVTKPPLSEKLLKKPPFRYLHDIIMAVNKNTGFFEGLFSKDELISENVKDRDKKIAFLQKVIKVINAVLSITLSVRPSKIISGQEPEKTNELLQTIGEALKQNLNSKEAINQIINENKISGEKPPKIKPQKSIDSVKKEKNSKPNKVIDEKPQIKKEVIPKNINKRKLSKTDENLKVIKQKSPEVKDAKVKTIRESSSNKKNVKEKSIIKDSNNSKKSFDDNQNDSPNSLESIINFEEIERNIEKLNEDGNNDIQIENENLLLKETNIENNLNVESSNSNDVNLISNSDSDITLPPPPQLVDNNNVDIESTQNKKSNKSADLQSTAKRVEVESKSETIAKEVDDKEKNLIIDIENKSASAERNKKEQEIVNNERKEHIIPRPATSLRPPSVRPSSSRPGAPRFKDTNVEIITTETVAKGKVNIIVEDYDKYLEEDDGGVIIESSISDNILPEESFLKNQANTANDHGHLVQQILETQKELSKNSQKIEIEWEWGARREREASYKEVEALKDGLQLLSRAANPLSKLIEYVQEDVEIMRQELLQWRETRKMVKETFFNYESNIDKSIKPLEAKLKQIENNIIDQTELISSVKANIYRNGKKIRQLINSENNM